MATAVPEDILPKLSIIMTDFENNVLHININYIGLLKK